MKRLALPFLILAFSSAHSAPTTLVAPFDQADIKEARAALQAERGLPPSIKNAVDQSLVLIPAGSFMMGSTMEQLKIATAEGDAWWKDGEPNRQITAEIPAHRVSITQPFYIAATETTIAQFRKFVEDTGYKTQAERDGQGGLYYQGKPSRGPELIWSTPHPGIEFSEQDPVTQVAWEDAQAYCAWLSKQEGETYRLPTEAEWEFAARAGSPDVWFFGDDRAMLAEYAHEGVQPLPVASKKPNPFGLYDVYGNVWEWCQDWFAGDLYTAEPRIDPVGPDSGNKHARRGGTFSTDFAQSRSAFRKGSPTNYRGLHVGFRVVREIPPEQ